MRRTLVIAVAVALLRCGGAPTGPDWRRGPISLIMTCELTSPALLCHAIVDCGLYGCPAGMPREVTDIATWTSDDTAIVRSVGGGRFEAVAPGDTVIHARWDYNAQRTVAVFPGTSPLLTSEIVGSVYDGPVPSTSAIDGAVVEVVSGAIAGRRAVSGTLPDRLPGFSVGPAAPAPGSYRILGVPPGVFRLRVSKDGYVPQEREVTHTIFSSTAASFQLQRE